MDPAIPPVYAQVHPTSPHGKAGAISSYSFCLARITAKSVGGLSASSTVPSRSESYWSASRALASTPIHRTQHRALGTWPANTT